MRVRGVELLRWGGGSLLAKVMGDMCVKNGQIYMCSVRGQGSVKGQGSRVKGQGSRVKGQGSRVKDQGSRVKGQGSRVKGRQRVNGKG